MANTEYENRNSSWFHFRVRGAQGKCLRFNMMNLNRHGKLFNQGMYPVFLAHDPATPLPNIMTESARWNRVQSVFSHSTKDGHFVSSFWQRISTNEDFYFSFTYPCSMRDQTEYLDNLEITHKKNDGGNFKDEEIYFHRELLCQSLDGRKVELVTISSFRKMSKLTGEFS